MDWGSLGSEAAEGFGESRASWPKYVCAPGMGIKGDECCMLAWRGKIG